MVSYDVKALFTSFGLGPAISIVKNYLQQDPLLPKWTSVSITQIICWSHALKIPTFSSRVSILNRCMVQTWVLPIAPLLPTCSWKSANPKPSAVPQIHPGFGLCMWMTPLSSNRLIMATRSSRTLIP